jgi:ABC-type nickel/cobalt efflux system permease component RcnA
MEGTMKRITTAVAAMALTTVMSFGPAQQAKADGGATIAIGVGVYLLADHLIGRECGREEWPLNIIRKIGDELHGRRGCYHKHHHDKHHHDKGHHRHHGYKDKHK